MDGRNPEGEPGAEAPSTTADGQIDRVFLSRVGARIRELRTEQSLTVQELATRSQISRRLLTQIEHGQANPSLVAITRLARQLGSDSTSLLAGADAPPAPLTVVPSSDQVLVWTSDAGSTAHLLVATSEVRSADLWLWRLAAGDTYHGNADPRGSHELFYVLAGVLTLRADTVEVEVARGEAARLHSDRAYVYANTGGAPTTFLRTVALGR